ncbi:MAG: MATE family efflux transporter, partial [Elusimicrobia bacterium]|nr:MATE family efflux transporter [Elusimicrobiota bacterium]
NEINQKGSVPELWKITYPLVISTASQTLMQFMNRMFLSWHSADAIAACVPAGALSFTFMSFFMGIAMYTNVFVAQFYGSKNYAKLSSALWQGVWVAVISWPLIAALIPFSYHIINISSHPASVKILEKQYLLIVMMFGAFAPLNAALASFFTGRGKTKITMLVNLAGNAVNIALSYFLAIKAGMGVQGAAIAYVLGNAAIACFFLAVIFSRHNRVKYKTRLLFKFNPALFRNIVKFGLPNGAGFMLDISSFTVFLFLAGNFDTATVAANNIVVAIDMLAFMPMFGLAIAVETLVGQYIGEKDKSSAIRTGYSAIKLALIYTLPMSVIFFFKPEIFSWSFGLGLTNQAAILSIAGGLLKVMAFFCIFDAISITLAGVIKGGGDTHFQMKTAVMCAWGLFVPGTYIILSVLQLPLSWAWGWGIIYMFSLSAIFYKRFRSGKWLEIDITK